MLGSTTDTTLSSHLEPSTTYAADGEKGASDHPKSDEEYALLTSPTTPEPSASSEEKSSEMIKRDKSYYMESNFMVFQVQKCLFRVPSYLFSKESHVFGGLFNLPQHSEKNGDPEGSYASNPIILPDDYLKNDFRALMKALYPLSFSVTLQLSKSEWISIIKLSTQWYFINLRKAAISELERMAVLTPVEKVVLGRKYRISSWIVSGFAVLVTRENTISDDEAIAIDTNYTTSAYRLYRLREERLKYERSYGSFSEKIRIEEVFNAELSVVRADEKGYDIKQEEIAFEPAAQSVLPTRSSAPAKKKGKIGAKGLSTNTNTLGFH